MFYYLSLLSHDWSPLNVFRYETFRAAAAALTAFLLSLAMGPRTIMLLTRLKLGQPLRQKSEVRELADLHSGKKGTPTMGGILILLTVAVSALLWCDPKQAGLARARLDALSRLYRVRGRLRKGGEEKFQGHSRLA